MGRTYALMGRKDEKMTPGKIAAELRKASSPTDQSGLAVIYAALGEDKRGVPLVRCRLVSRFSWMPWIADFSRLKTDLFTSLRLDRRLAALIKSVGIPVASGVQAFPKVD